MPQSITQPVEIVGAGPGGLTAAIILAHAGCSVRVYELRSDVGKRFHGDFQGLENWSTREDVKDFLENIGIRFNFLCSPVSKVTLFDAALRKYEIATSQPLFYLLQRGSFEGTLDFGLKTQAIDLGVEIIFNKRIAELPHGGIMATGPKRADVTAKGIVFDTDHPDGVIAITDDQLSPKGYSYLISHNGKATLSTVLYRDFHKEKSSYEKTVETFQKLFSLKIENPKEFGGYGSFWIDSIQEKEGVYKIGEAGGFQDPLFGFGIRHSMTTGYLAAKAIIEGKSYDFLWKEQLLNYLKAGLVNRFFFERKGNAGYRLLLNHIAKSRDAREFMLKYYGRSSWKDLFYPPVSLIYKILGRFQPI